MSIENTHHGAKIAASWLALAKRVVMLGIGGVGMYGIASELKRRGKTVVGEDKTPNHLTRTLALGGVLVLLGEEHLPLGEGDVLVYTNAISKDHPTYQKAQSMGIPILSRAEALAGLASSYSPEIALAGVHGKTTVTTMTGHILTEGGLDPTIFCGGIMKNENSPYRAGNGGVVYEACEYMQSFLAFTPEIGVVLNIEWEHVDAYPTPESIDVAFERFAFQSEHLVAPLEVCSRGRFCEHPHLYTFSLHDRGAFCYAKDMRHKKGRYHFTLCQNGEEIDEISLLVQGEFQIKNALASSVVGRLCGVDGTSICRSLSSETGAKRRLEHRGFFGENTCF